MDSTEEDIKEYLDSQPEPKKAEMIALHHFVLSCIPNCKLWFLDGKNDQNKIVTNPNIGYGQQTITYANGKNREFYQIGISANNFGISVYILGIKDKTFLKRTFSEKIGKASISGYCIKFKSLKNINLNTLETAIRSGLEGKY